MRIAGITIDDNTRLEYGLTAVFGIGHSRSLKVLKEVQVDPDRKPKDLTPDEEKKIRDTVESFVIEGELRRATSGNIKRLKDIKCYRGMRHSKHLPARGQRTKTNSRTVRGNTRKTMTSGRRKVEKK